MTVIIYAIVVGLVMISILVLRQRWRLAVQRAELALLTSTERGDFDRIQRLLQRRTNVNARNAQGWTPLHIAAAGGDITLVDLLLRHGADVNAESYVGATPLDHAVTSGKGQELVRLLRQYGGRGYTDGDAIF